MFFVTRSAETLRRILLRMLKGIIEPSSHLGLVIKSQYKESPSLFNIKLRNVKFSWF